MMKERLSRGRSNEFLDGLVPARAQPFKQPYPSFFTLPLEIHRRFYAAAAALATYASGEIMSEKLDFQIVVS
jgi:hypothetical protein